MPDFSDVTKANIESYLESGQLKTVYLISPEYFGGSEGPDNQIFVTPSAQAAKQVIDDELYDALKQGKEVGNFHIDLEYKDGTESIVPTKIIVQAVIDGEDYNRVVEVW